jgi:hypothetical protein
MAIKVHQVHLEHKALKEIQVHRVPKDLKVL